ncbi:branched-chain amino acid transporter permease [Leuconostoc pseudomesenteroides]|uniref:branched-chain amino acid transporter permease n=1 Tax=Leuconostoc pseudomesenteroides TaxID=33968 RepID=UPI00345E61F5
MTILEQIITIGIAAVVTMLTRFLPFWLYPNDQKTPKYIHLLGNFLPPAILGILVIYCYSNTLTSVNLATYLSVIAGMITVFLQLWRKNMLLSIFGGTFCYIILLALF